MTNSAATFAVGALIGAASFLAGFAVGTLTERAKVRRERLARVVPFPRAAAPGNAETFELPMLGAVRAGEMLDD